MTITLWDIPSTVGPWSPNTWKVRYCLSLKKIPYRTEWVEYPDIATRCEQLGIPPTGANPDKWPYYTLPAIHDSATGVYISDSPRIAEYLEAQYPAAPQIFPHNSIGLQIDFDDRLDAKLDRMWNFVIPPVWHILNPASQEYFRTTRARAWGKKFEDIMPTGEVAVAEWTKVQAGFAEMANWYSKKGGPFIMGKEVSWADFVVGAHLVWFNKAWGDDDPKWKEILSSNGGVWSALFDALKEYGSVN